MYAYGIEESEHIYFDFRNKSAENKEKNDTKPQDRLTKTNLIELIKDGKLNMGYLYKLGLNKDELKDILNINDINELKKFDSIVIEEIKE